MACAANHNNQKNFFSLNLEKENYEQKKNEYNNYLTSKREKGDYLYTYLKVLNNAWNYIKYACWYISEKDYKKNAKNEIGRGLKDKEFDEKIREKSEKIYNEITKKRRTITKLEDKEKLEKFITNLLEIDNLEEKEKKIIMLLQFEFDFFGHVELTYILKNLDNKELNGFLIFVKKEKENDDKSFSNNTKLKTAKRELYYKLFSELVKIGNINEKVKYIFEKLPNHIKTRGNGLTISELEIIKDIVPLIKEDIEDSNVECKYYKIKLDNLFNLEKKGEYLAAYKEKYANTMRDTAERDINNKYKRLPKIQ